MSKSIKTHIYLLLLLSYVIIGHIMLWLLSISKYSLPLRGESYKGELVAENTLLFAYKINSEFKTSSERML